MEHVFGGLIGIIIVYLVGKGLRRLPHLYRRSLEAAGLFLALVIVVIFTAGELAYAFRDNGTLGDKFGICILVAGQMVFAAYLAFGTMMRLMVVARLHQEQERERRDRFYSAIDR